jgi:hypothetical protein
MQLEMFGKMGLPEWLPGVREIVLSISRVTKDGKDKAVKYEQWLAWSSALSARWVMGEESAS